MEHPFAAWAGTWRGRGDGEYPTIEDFAWTEELVIEPVPGRPVAMWRSRTRDEPTGEPRHAEAGFLRAGEAVALVIAHSFGASEMALGTLEHGVLRLRAGPVPTVPGGKRIDGVERTYALRGDRIEYTMAMAAVGVDMTHHLAGSLRRVDGNNPRD